MAKQIPTSRVVTKKHTARLERERQQVRLIQTISFAAIAIVVLLVGYGILDTTYLRLRKPVAEVNGEQIKLNYWQERIQFTRINMANNLQQYQFYQQNFGMDTTQQIQELQFYLQSPELLGDQVLNTLIDETVIRQEAQKRGITVTDEEVEAKIQGSLNFYPNGTPTPTITPTEFSFPTLTSEQLKLLPVTSTPTEVQTSTPAPTNTPDPAATVAPATPTFLPQPPTATATPYTADGYKEQYGTSLENIKTFGVSEATFRSVYENQLYKEKLLAEIAKDAPRTQEQALARHVLVDDQQLAGTLYVLLNAGQDFAEIAKKYSKDTGSGANGGDLGWFGKGAMVPEFEAAVFSQAIGEVGKPVQSQFGYHIIQVIAREELPATASQYEQNQQTTFTDWLTKTRTDAETAATITKFDDTWRVNLPALPVAISQLLQSLQQPQQP
jgi:parvulin-like peptidyl-prolyl isomerase